MSVYPNWRDYTERFRDLLNVGGGLTLSGKTLCVELNPMAQPRHQESAEAYVKKILRLSPQTFGIGPYGIKFGLKS